MLPLLLDQTPFEVASSYLESSTDRPDFTYFAGAGCGLLLLWGAIAAFDRGLKWYRANAQTPEALFHDLCEAHAIERQDRLVIEAAAALEPPVIGAMVFVEPARLERLAAEQPAWREGVARVARRLFGTI